MLDLFHVAFSRLVRFREMFRDIGCSESRKRGEITVSNCCKQGVFGGKTECSVEVSNCMCGRREVIDVVNTVLRRVAEDAFWFCKGYAPESVFVSAPLEDGRPFAGDSDVFVIVDRRAFLPLVKNGDVPMVSKSSNAE